MLDKYNQEYDQKIARIRLDFLSGKTTSLNGIRKEIQESWIRCKQLGMKSSSSKIDEFPSREDTDQITSFLRADLLLNKNRTFYDILDEYNGASFYITPNNSMVFSQKGNDKLLQHLNKFKLEIGCCFTEENFGTTALSLEPSKFADSWVVGEEHYSDLFTPFFTYAYYGDYKFAGLKVKILIILPKELFSRLFIQYLREYNDSCKLMISSYRSSIEGQLKEVFYRQYEQNQKQGIILLDAFGKILSINLKFTQLMKVSQEDIKGQDCIKVFPELERILVSLKNGELIHFEEVQIGNPPVNMHLEVNTVYEEQQIIGQILIFSDSKRIRQAINKISNARAFYTFDNILGKSEAIKVIKQKAIEVANSKSPVIITGESGTGKELFAQAIHNASDMRNGPFVAVNCAAFSSELITSELFGYVEGAFTGARKGGAMGKFEYANDGTIFLDEIGEMSMSAQSMLLRVLEERKVTRLGSSEEIPVNVRLISATNKDLRKLVKEKMFRLDLFYRIFVVNIHLPALRDHIQDLPILVNYFIEYYNSLLNKQVKGIDPDALSYLLNHRWPGNIRELRNIIECGMNSTSGNVLKMNDLPPVLDYGPGDEIIGNEQMIDIEKEYNLKEKQKILSLMIELKGNKSQVAKAMGISRSNLYNKMKAYDLL